MCFKSASYILKSVSPSSTEKPLADTNAISVCIFLSKSAPSSPSMEADALVTIPPVHDESSDTHEKQGEDHR